MKAITVGTDYGLLHVTIDSLGNLPTQYDVGTRPSGQNEHPCVSTKLEVLSGGNDIVSRSSY